MKRFASLLMAAIMLCGVMVGSALAVNPAEAATLTETEQRITAPALYPSAVTEYAEGDSRRISKTYELAEADDPSAIPTADFSRDGVAYTLLDLTRQDETATDIVPVQSVSTAGTCTIAAVSGLYPTEIKEYIEGDMHRLDKVYVLSASDDAADIPTADFERGGIAYTLLDITRADQTGIDTRAMIHTVPPRTRPGMDARQVNPCMPNGAAETPRSKKPRSVWTSGPCRALFLTAPAQDTAEPGPSGSGRRQPPPRSKRPRPPKGRPRLLCRKNVHAHSSVSPS